VDRMPYEPFSPLNNAWKLRSSRGKINAWLARRTTRLTIYRTPCLTIREDC